MPAGSIVMNFPFASLMSKTARNLSNKALTTFFPCVLDLIKIIPKKGCFLDNESPEKPSSASLLEADVQHLGVFYSINLFVMNAINNMDAL
jgi:hypothetical protein